ncbi:unnamed protein product [Leptidea sinapis]|uniref:Uncharacterized protein n=1 Tax=Leptidea sinapis TaxID=189913 RepID=A0A5E4QX99_9NEOP|nr:unnamed protein product [Leptidea sinapis]
MYKEIFVILSAFILMHTNALPRDSSVVITETVSPIADTISSKVKEPSNESFSETARSSSKSGSCFFSLRTILSLAARRPTSIASLAEP